MYGASAALGFGSSISLVTVLTMLADLIAENVVRNLFVRNHHTDWHPSNLSKLKCFIRVFVFKLVFGSLLNFVVLLVFALL